VAGRHGPTPRSDVGAGRFCWKWNLSLLQDKSANAGKKPKNR
jgi:hypothetical protein